VSDRRTFRVSEIFESIQGEGPSAGAPSVFLRLATCNLRCAWCDTKYTWDWDAFRYEDEVHPIPVAEVARRILEASSRRLVVTGGEPLLQRREIESLVEKLPPDLPIEIETNGTLAPGATLEARVDQWNVSPKLGNSGESPERRLKRDVLTRLRNTGRAFLKVVVEDDGDLGELAELLSETNWPRERTFLMPQASSRESLIAMSPAVAALAERLGVRTSPRLHVLHWGGQRGR
jgi:organic radical activating enzyme